MSYRMKTSPYFLSTTICRECIGIIRMSNLIAHKIHEEQYESLERSKEEPKEWIFPELLFFLWTM